MKETIETFFFILLNSKYKIPTIIILSIIIVLIACVVLMFIINNIRDVYDLVYYFKNGSLKRKENLVKLMDQRAIIHNEKIAGLNEILTLLHENIAEAERIKNDYPDDTEIQYKVDMTLIHVDENINKTNNLINSEQIDYDTFVKRCERMKMEMEETEKEYSEMRAYIKDKLKF